MNSEHETAWVVTSGAYDDYAVVAVIRGGKAEADRLAARIEGDGYRVESLPVVDADVRCEEILTLRAEVHDDGTVRVAQRIIREWAFDKEWSAVSWSWNRQPDPAGWGILNVRGADH